MIEGLRGPGACREESKFTEDQIALIEPTQWAAVFHSTKKT